jgi:ankyrin repeat protein
MPAPFPLLKYCLRNMFKHGGKSSILHLAILADDFAVISSLLKRSDINVNCPDALGQTPLHVAARTRGPNYIQALLERSETDINAIDKSGQTPLQAVCSTAIIITAPSDRVLLVTRELLSCPLIRVNAADRSGRTALYWASQSGNLDLVGLLLSHPSINVNAADSIGFTALHVACSKGYEDMVRLLLARSDMIVNSPSALWTPLHVACCEGHINVTRILLEHDKIYRKKLLNAADKFGQSALHIASHQGHHEIVSLLRSQPNIKIRPLRLFPTK